MGDHCERISRRAIAPVRCLTAFGANVYRIAIFAVEEYTGPPGPFLRLAAGRRHGSRLLGVGVLIGAFLWVLVFWLTRG